MLSVGCTNLGPLATADSVAVSDVVGLADSLAGKQSTNANLDAWSEISPAGVTTSDFPSINFAAYTSADRTPYLITYASTVTVSRANTDYQALASIGGPCTIIFEAGVTNYGSTIHFEIPPVGTNSVTLAAGPDYRYGDSLTGPNTTNRTYCLYQSPYNSTNRMVTLYRGPQ